MRLSKLLRNSDDDDVVGVGSHFVDLRAAHPDRLDDLEDGRPDHDEHKQGDKLRADRVAVVLLAGLRHVPALGDVLGVFVVRLAHLRGHRHLAGCLGKLSLVEVNQAILA